MPRRIAITASAPGNGKTTLGRAVATRLDVPFIETHLLAWDGGIHVPADVLWARLADVVVGTDAWVIDGVYRGRVGNLILGAADAVVWLDLPIRSWLPRLVRRSVRQRHSPRRIAAAVLAAFRGHLSRRRRYPALFAGLPLVRLRSDADVALWLQQVAR
jgi:adenylate kinase family enzyme